MHSRYSTYILVEYPSFQDRMRIAKLADLFTIPGTSREETCMLLVMHCFHRLLTLSRQTHVAMANDMALRYAKSDLFAHFANASCYAWLQHL